MNHIVVVGASLAGMRACETLRDSGHSGEITLVGAEHHRPYDRPPLSKRLLLGDWEPERIQLRSNDAFDALNLNSNPELWPQGFLWRVVRSHLMDQVSVLGPITKHRKCRLTAW